MNTKDCSNCSYRFSVSEQQLAFLDRISPIFEGQKHPIPQPKLCPICRRQRRIAWRNERHLYKRECQATGKLIYSNISPDSPFTVYDREYWFTDQWSALNYGRDFDFSKTFAENFSALQIDTPRFSLQQPERMENSEYCNFASNCKDSYFLFDSDFCRDVYYSDCVNGLTDCCDCGYSSDCELCYDVVSCKNCYNIRYSQNCQSCSDSSFLYGCIGCQNCLFCTNLRNKQYCYRNQQLSPEEYREVEKTVGLEKYSAIQDLKSEFSVFIEGFPRRFMQGVNNENCSGDYISNSKNVLESYDIVEGWDLAYCDFLHRSQNCLDVSSFGEGIEWMYECATAGLGSHSCAFCFTVVTNCSNVYYCDTALASKNCFGCVSIHRGEYCVLNKQYNSSDYEKLVSKIIYHMQETGEWGEFFDYKLSPVCYDESVANEYYPLQKSQALELGASWRGLNVKIASQISVPPENIEELKDEDAIKLYSCLQCSREYQLTSAEIKHYRKTNTPPPKDCPYCRHKDRMELRGTRVLNTRNCSKCDKSFLTTITNNYRGEVWL